MRRDWRENPYIFDVRKHSFGGKVMNKELIERAVARGLILRPAPQKPKTHVRKSRLSRIMTDRRNSK